MLGDQLGQEAGQITATRVLPGPGAGPNVEVSFQANGRMMDVDVTDTGTYTATARPDGTLFGEGQGLIVTHTGETATWRGQGVGRMTGRGSAVSWRGSIFYETQSRDLARLNGIAAMFEHDTDESGKTESTVYEWK